MKNKFIKIIAVFLVFACVIGVSCFFAYRFVTRKAADVVIKSFVKDELNNMIDKGILNVEDIYNSLAVSGALLPPKTDVEDNADSGEEGISVPVENETEVELPTEIPPEQAQPEKDNAVPDAVEEARKQPSLPETEKEPEQLSKEEVIEQKANEVASFVDPADKDRMAALIKSKLTASDISYLASLLSGGLTLEEKRLAVKLARSKYTKAELKELQGYYHKYLGDHNLVSGN